MNRGGGLGFIQVTVTTLVIIDDHKIIRDALRALMGNTDGMSVIGEGGRLQQRPDCTVRGLGCVRGNCSSLFGKRYVKVFRGIRLFLSPTTAGRPHDRTWSTIRRAVWRLGFLFQNIYER